MNINTAQDALNLLDEIERERVTFINDARALALAYGVSSPDGDLFVDAVLAAFRHLTDFKVRRNKERIREALDG